MRLNVGSSTSSLPGFTNVDVRRASGVDKHGHAADLSFAATGAVEVIFVNAVLEHLYLAQQLSALREWTRVLSPRGRIVVLGIPDFMTIARLYLAQAPGVLGERFDLFNVYRYTHGDPEASTAVTWRAWDPSRHVNDAPSGWLPQLHKAIFDAGYVHDLFGRSGLQATVFRYAYPRESVCVNLGVLAHKGSPVEEPREELATLIPHVEGFIDLETISQVSPTPGMRDSLLDQAELADGARKRPLLERGARRMHREFDRRFHPTRETTLQNGP